MTAEADMTADAIAMLPDRGVVALTGPDAESWLDNLVSNDLALLQRDAHVFTGLLSPQGKVLFEFFIYRGSDCLLLETTSSSADGLIKRLKLYKLRAKIELVDATADWSVIWGRGSLPIALPNAAIAGVDPRAPADLWRGICPRSASLGLTVGGAYLQARVGLGIAEAPDDYMLGDVFPHEANFDLQNGLSFTKGCYVGQEVVSRMQNKTVVRKRVVKVSARNAMIGGAPIAAGSAVIGSVGSVDGSHALAMLRLDRAAEALDAGTPLISAGVEIDVDAEAIKRYRQSLLDRPVHDL